MTTIATRAEESRELRRWFEVPWLSGRLMLLTMAFSILAQVVVYLPAASSFVRSWTSDRVMGGRMLALALTAAPPEARTRELEARLLEGMGGPLAIRIHGGGTPWLIARDGIEPRVDREIDIRRATWFGPLRAVLRALSWAGPSTVRLITPGVDGVDRVDLVIDDTAFRDAVLAFTRSYFLVSTLISLITGALLYLALHVVVVGPVRRLSGNIASFAANPEDASRVIAPSGRQDEIGRAEEALARMEAALSGELRQRHHLAELGLAVSKVNHELRNMLTTAQLLGDRLSEVDDPAVRRVTPRLIRTLGRAIAYCEATLAYGRASESPPQRRLVKLRPLVEDQLDLARLADGVPITIEIDVPSDLQVDADPDHLARVLLNLMRNAVEALSQARTADARIDVVARRAGNSVTMRVSDNGPGIPGRIRERLFSAFQSSERSGGTGLGLPVADELIRLHGGRLTLEAGGGPGATFAMTISDRLSVAGALAAG